MAIEQEKLFDELTIEDSKPGIIYIIPGHNKPVKVVNVSDNITVDDDGYNVTVKRPLAEPEFESFKECIRNVKSGCYNVLTDGRKIYEARECDGKTED